jgi:plastocyanin
MKQMLLPFLFLFMATKSMAGITTITVTNFQFSPANTTVAVGDTVRFDFAVGFHNATSAGNTLPTGAAAINSGAPSSLVRTFDYVVTDPGTYDYYCEVHGGPGGVGMAGAFTATSPLPLVLGSFTGTINMDKHATINWNTYNERNVQVYSLQRSKDGMKFSEIAKIVPQNGNSQQYTYSDKEAVAERYVFYQLVITDLDGSKTYSRILSLKNVYDNGKLVTQIGPSPLTRPQQLMLQFNAEKAGWMNADVYDLKGKRVMEVKLQALPGLNNGHIHLCDLDEGKYLIRFSYENKVETKQVVVY